MPTIMVFAKEAASLNEGQSAIIEAGLPAGVVKFVLGFDDTVGSKLCNHHDVDMVSFTGSTPKCVAI